LNLNIVHVILLCIGTAIIDVVDLSIATTHIPSFIRMAISNELVCDLKALRSFPCLTIQYFIFPISIQYFSFCLFDCCSLYYYFVLMSPFPSPMVIFFLF